MNEKNPPYLREQTGKSDLPMTWLQEKKNGLLNAKKLTKQRLGFGGEKVRDAEDGGGEFLFILKIFPAQSLMSSMPDLISYWPRTAEAELICVDDITLPPGTDSSDGCGPLGLSGCHAGSNIVGGCRCLCVWVQEGTAGQEEGEGWQEEARWGSANYQLPSPLQTQQLHLNDKCYYSSSILPTVMFLLANLENSPREQQIAYPTKLPP